jgi:Glyoxalase superfamily protein
MTGSGVRNEHRFSFDGTYEGKAVMPVEQVCQDYFSHLRVNKLIQKLTLWRNTDSPCANGSKPEVRMVTPAIRIFDTVKAKEFYLGYLGFKTDWEHRYDDKAPLYTQVSRGGL